MAIHMFQTPPELKWQQQHFFPLLVASCFELDNIPSCALCPFLNREQYVHDPGCTVTQYWRDVLNKYSRRLMNSPLNLVSLSIRFPSKVNQGRPKETFRPSQKIYCAHGHRSSLAWIFPFLHPPRSGIQLPAYSR